MTESFAGKTVVLTGAGRGLGRGIAEAFAAAGAQVMIGSRTLAPAEEVKAGILAAGGTAEFQLCDVCRLHRPHRGRGQALRRRRRGDPLRRRHSAWRARRGLG
jgi:NAD(P)-dependent dehydrogenase (short-subunit alcohol dehydrogenase family)